jgi:hypothetical protein
MADTDTAIIDFLNEHMPELAEKTKPSTEGFGDLEKAQVRVLTEHISRLLKPHEADTFDEEDEDGVLHDPILFTSTMPGLVAAQKVLKDYTQAVILDEAAWRKWMEATYGNSRPILRGFKRVFCYFTSVLGELEVKEHVSDMRLKGTQYLQLQEGVQLALANTNIRKSSWGWDGKELEPTDNEENE